MSATDTARALAMSKRTLQRMSHRGEGPPFISFRGERGTTFRYPRAGVLAWIERNTVVPAAHA